MGEIEEKTKLDKVIEYGAAYALWTWGALATLLIALNVAYVGGWLP